MKSIRQGDVLILAVKEIPAEAKPAKRDKGSIILAYGEVTGHSHAITDRQAKSFLVGDNLYLDLSRRADVGHEEHGTVILEPGKYQVINQVEYKRKQIVRVID